MARKSNDLFSLLSSRHKGRNSRRSSSGIFSQVGGLLKFAFGGNTSADIPKSAAAGIHLSGLGLAAVIFACLGIGYLVGDHFPLQAGQKGLQMAPGNQGKQFPGPVGPVDRWALAEEEEIKPLGNKGLLVGIGNDSDRAKENAFGLAHYLRSKGLVKARSHRRWSNDNATSYWTTIVYFDGAAERQKVEDQLKQVVAPTEFPCFDKLRQRNDWPTTLDVQ